MYIDSRTKEGKEGGLESLGASGSTSTDNMPAHMQCGVLNSSLSLDLGKTWKHTRALCKRYRLELAQQLQRPVTCTVTGNISKCAQA
eukprot:2064874-Amphidinium_carterae.1